MKRTLIPILLLILCSINLTAQDTIVLDGKKIPKEKLNPYNGEGYEVELTKPENKPSLANPSIGIGMKITSQRVFASKGMKSFVQSTVSERADSAAYYLPSSSLKFFDENGKVKWEKKLDGKIPFSCYLSPDGKYSVFDIRTFSSYDPEGPECKNSLSIYNEKGVAICEYLFPVKFRVSISRDIVCYYQEDVGITNNIEENKKFYCFDLKTGNLWDKNFEKEVEAEPCSKNGDYIIAWCNKFYSLFYRDGSEIFKRHVNEFGGNIDAVSNDGKYALSIQSSLTDTTFFDIYDIKTMKRIRTRYLDLEKSKFKVYNGGNFVNNSFYIVALTSIIAPGTAMIVFHNLQGEYIGHKVYYNIPSSFWNPTISLLDNGSFEVFMDGNYL